jgi:hypothetical protein
MNNIKKQYARSNKDQDYFQIIQLKCSQQHVNTSLSNWRKNFNIPLNLRKLEYEIENFTLENYKKKKE